VSAVLQEEHVEEAAAAEVQAARGAQGHRGIGSKEENDEGVKEEEPW
jgi:hypothetical protein